MASLIRELAAYMRVRKKWWLLPIIIFLICLSMLVALGSTAMAPFIYTLF